MTVPYGYCHCGCGEKTTIVPNSDRSRGLLKGEPYRYLKGHHWHKSPIEYLVEDRGYDTPCWIWQRAISQGYGMVRPAPHAKKIGAHRFYYQKVKGPVPAGLELDHLCRNRACVNPDHLEAVTRRENNLRGEGPAAKNARKTHCKRGHPLEGDNIKWTVAGHRTCRACANAHWRRYAAQKRAA